MTEHELLVDCLQRLNRAGIDYMLTGSMASNYWGIPRSTHDLHFVVLLTTQVIPRVVQAFADGFHLDEESVRAALKPPYQFNAIDLRSALKVDFWSLRSVPFEQEMFTRRLSITLLGERAWVATPEDVILHKLYWNELTPSERQLGDAAGIVAVQGAALDRDYLRAQADALEVAPSLEAILSGKIRPKRT